VSFARLKLDVFIFRWDVNTIKKTKNEKWRHVDCVYVYTIHVKPNRGHFSSEAREGQNQTHTVTDLESVDYYLSDFKACGQTCGKRQTNSAGPSPSRQITHLRHLSESGPDSLHINEELRLLTCAPGEMRWWDMFFVIGISEHESHRLRMLIWSPW